LNGDLTSVSGPFFNSPDDVKFMTSKGEEQFIDASMVPPDVGTGRAITRTVHSHETNQTIYTYLITIRFKVGPEGQQREIAVRIDPEVDNPPPVPRP
jgi:hypothetical protein